MPRPRHLHHAAEYAKHHRKNMPVSEAALWNRIRRKQLGVRFRRQVPIGPYIADFACLNPRIVIEVDGSDHDWKDEEERTYFLESQGFTVLRINNREVAFDEGDLARWLRLRIDAVSEGREVDD